MTGSEIENSAIKTAYLSLEISKPLSAVGILFSVRYVLLNGKLVFHFVCNCMCFWYEKYGTTNGHTCVSFSCMIELP